MPDTTDPAEPEKISLAEILNDFDMKLLILRGSGDLFGYKQSGEVQFKIANLHRDFNILKQASIDSEAILNSKEDVKQNKEILSKILFSLLYFFIRCKANSKLLFFIASI